MSQSRSGVKRTLKDVLEAGLARNAEQESKLVTVVFDVKSSNGDLIGLATHASDGRPVYVDPPALQGVEVMYPMTLQTTPNSTVLAAALGRALQTELGR